MDLEGWEILPEDGYLEIQYDGGNKIFSRKYGADDPNNLYKNNYFICPSQDSPEFMESTEKSTCRGAKQLLPVPIQLPPPFDVVNEINREPIKKSSSGSLQRIKVVSDSGVLLEADHDTVSQVFFKKMIENKSVDMKLDSPKSNNKGIIPRHANKENIINDEALEGKSLFPGSEYVKGLDIKKEVTWRHNSGKLNIWKWRFDGFGVICSFGIIAASICIIILGGREQNKQLHQQNKKDHFRIVAEDKMIKEVVQDPTRSNEAI